MVQGAFDDGAHQDRSSHALNKAFLEKAALSTIGFFDSGLGGLSILQLAWAQRPQHHYVYLADTAHNPYGEKPAQWIKERGLELVDHLCKDHGCEVIVVACNTATAEAIQDIRLSFPQLRVIGVEPGIKPATLLTQSKSIGILATKATLQSKKFNDLIASMPQGFEFIKIPGTGLVELIEEAQHDPTKIQLWLDEHLTALRQSCADTLVLGCTHYPFIKALIQEHLGPQIQLLDTGQAVVNHLAKSLDTYATSHPMDAQNEHAQGSVLWLCNVDPELFAYRAEKLLVHMPIKGARAERLKV